MLNIAICDDSHEFVELAAKKLQCILNDIMTKAKIWRFYSGNDLLANLQKVKFEIIFLDIEMPNLSGLETANALREIDTSALLIFITNKNEEVYKVFQYNTFRFIRKTFFDEEITAILQSALDSVKMNFKNLIFNTKDGTISLAVAPILYFSIIKRYVNVKTLDSTYVLLYRTMGEISEMLQDYDFVLIYKGQLVNLQHIKDIKHSDRKMSIVLDNGEALPVAREKIGEVKAAFFQYGGKTLRC